MDKKQALRNTKKYARSRVGNSEDLCDWQSTVLNFHLEGMLMRKNFTLDSLHYLPLIKCT